MKFQHLPLGASFEYEGKVYVKVGPITAAAEDGGQRLIPRHAALKPVGPATAGRAPQVARELDESAVRAAVDDFLAECARVAEACCPAAQQTMLHAGLAAARERLLAALARS